MRIAHDRRSVQRVRGVVLFGAGRRPAIPQRYNPREPGAKPLVVPHAGTEGVKTDVSAFWSEVKSPEVTLTVRSGAATLLMTGAGGIGGVAAANAICGTRRRSRARRITARSSANSRRR